MALPAGYAGAFFGNERLRQLDLSTCIVNPIPSKSEGLGISVKGRGALEGLPKYRHDRRKQLRPVARQRADASRISYEA
jgi:hypothetical protein